jgi:lipase (class 3)
MFIPTTDQMARYAIAMLANLGQVAAGDDGSKTGSAIAARLKLPSVQKKIGTWSVVWGPALCYEVPGGTPDNIIYVAQQANTNNYAIGIAGTNFGSVLDVLVEDLWVENTVPWVIGDAPQGAAIAAGTSKGLSYLLTTPALVQNPPGLGTLTEFLFAKSLEGPLNISVCGHSLGGALATVLALYLQNMRGLWDASKQSKVMAQPVAAPTAGNTIFANYASATVPFDGFYNSLDVVPNAWVEKDLDQLPGLYDSDLSTVLMVWVVVQIAKGISSSKDYYHTTTRTPLQGTLQPGLDYLKQSGYQHMNAYDALFGFDPLELQPPSKPDTGKISTALAAAIEKSGGNIPPNVQIVPRRTKSVSYGNTTFRVPEAADVNQVLQALMTFDTKFRGATGA